MRIEHIALYVSDLERARDFYERYFNGRAGEMYLNPKTGFRSYFLSFEDGSRLELMTRPEVSYADRTEFQKGYAHIAFSVGSREAVNNLTERLSADGFIIVSAPRVTGDGYYESCVTDCDGNRVEITV